MSVSYWRRRPNPAELDADLVVVGAGVCGLAAALHAESRGLSTLVLEAGEVGQGASSRNAGFLMRGAAESYDRAIRTWGRERARALWRYSEENLELLRELGAASLPSYRAVPSCVLALDESEADELARSAQQMQEDGFDTALVRSGAEGAGDDVWTRLAPLLGLINPHDASVNPCEVLGLLGGRLCTPVRQRHEVIDWVDTTGGRLVVRTRVLHVRTPRVLLCVNAFAQRLVPSLAGQVTPHRGQMLAVAAPGLRLDHSYYANFGSEYFRITPEGVLVVGGFRTGHAASEAGYLDEPASPVQHELEAFAARILGRDRIEPIARWAGTMGFSRDGLPLVGPVAEDPRVWFCGGFTGHGMSLGVRTARDAVEAMLGLSPSLFAAPAGAAAT